MTPDATVDIRTLPARERVLATALALFYRDGIRATGIDRVIAEAGVTKVTFYRHFPSKDALVVAFLESRQERWMAWFRDALARHAARAGACHVRGATLLVDLPFPAYPDNLGHWAEMAWPAYGAFAGGNGSAWREAKPPEAAPGV